METLSERFVAETLRETASFTPEQFSEETDDISLVQPEIISFIEEFTEPLSNEIYNLSIYIFTVTYRIFEEGFGESIPIVTLGELADSLHNNEQHMGRLDGTHNKFYENMAKIQMSVQPNVTKYVIKTLVGAAHTNNHNISHEDIIHIFLLIKSIIDVLDIKTES